MGYLVPGPITLLVVFLIILYRLWRLHMDIAGLQSHIDALKAAIEAIPAPTPPVDLQPVADQLDALTAEATAKAAP
jgi:hypothetical protein